SSIAAVRYPKGFVFLVILCCIACFAIIAGNRADQGAASIWCNIGDRASAYCSVAREILVSASTSCLFQYGLGFCVYDPVASSQGHAERVNGLGCSPVQVVTTPFVSTITGATPARRGKVASAVITTDGAEVYMCYLLAIVFIAFFAVEVACVGGVVAIVVADIGHADNCWKFNRGYQG